MADTATFEEFVSTRSAYLLRTAYALTRDHTNAEDLLQTALARSWPAWGRIEEDPEPYVRQVMVNTYRSWWRRKWNGERPTNELPEIAGNVPQSSVDDRDEVLRALSRLPKKQQAVLVLRYFEDLSEAQIAATLDMAPGTVKSYASRGLATLRLDPALLTELKIPAPPAGSERIAAVKERIIQHKRSRITTAVAAFAGVLGVLLGFSLSPLHSAVPATTPGGFPEYLSGYRIVASKQIPFASSGESFTWVPADWNAAIYVMCTHNDRDIMVSVKAVINGQTLADYGCFDGQTMTPLLAALGSEEILRKAGVQLGQPVEVKIVVDEPVRGTGADLNWESADQVPEEGTAAIGIGQQVPYGDYPLPRKPKALISLDPYGPGLASLTLSGSRSSVPVPLQRGRSYLIKARSQTPGQLFITVDGERRHTMTWWDYSAVEQTLQLDWKDPTLFGGVQLTITTKGMTGTTVISVRQ